MSVKKKIILAIAGSAALASATPAEARGCGIWGLFGFCKMQSF